MDFTPEQIIKYIVWYATQKASRLTITRVIKFIYLADLYYARDHNGKTMTGWPWAFVDYGPYCREAHQAVESAASHGLIAKTVYDSKYESHEEYCLFHCDDENEPEIESRLPLGLVGQLRRAISKWGDDTASLLDHVYFETEPMQYAEPGQALDFAKAKPVQRSRPVELKRLSPDKIELAKQHIRNLGKELEAGRVRLQRVGEKTSKLTDEAYFRAIDYMDGEGLEPGLKGIAKITK